MLEIADILKISEPIVIGENEKCVFYFMEKKTIWTFDQSSISIRANYAACGKRRTWHVRGSERNGGILWLEPPKLYRKVCELFFV